MMNLRKLVLIIISVLLCTSFAYAQLTTSQVVKKYSPSVVTIVAFDPNDQPLSLGSGFFINADGDIASNHHLLEGSTKAIIKTMDGRKGEILEVINDDPELDLLIAVLVSKCRLLIGRVVNAKPKWYQERQQTSVSLSQRV